MKILFYDVETTGLNYWEHEMHQLAGFIVENDNIIEQFDFRLRPIKANIREESISYSNKSIEELLEYPDSSLAYNGFSSILNKHGKLMLAGYNIAAFDNLFLKQWFINNQSDLYKYVYSNCLDVMVLATQYLLDERESMDSFSLKSVAKKLNISLDYTKLHEGMFDAKLTYEVYNTIKKHYQQH